MFGLGRDVGIDLGTATVLIHIRGKGIVLREPSVVALERHSGKILAVGAEARRMLGRTPGNIVATRPLRNGVIADYEVTRAMLKHFLDRVTGPRFFARPRVMICIPAVVTTVEKRAVLEAAMEVGARHASLIEEPLAAALGAGLDVTKPAGHMVVDIGGGTTDVAVLSLGGVVQSQSIRVAGDKFDEAIMRYVKREHNLLIGERTAEEIKISIATASGSRNEAMEVRGRDLMTGLPKTIRLTSAETRIALEEPVTAIVQTVKTVLEQTPPELTADIHERGIVLTGGGALLHGLDELITRETGIPAHVADDPASCVAKGTGIALERYETMEDHLVVLKRVL
ncbi:rod shape-determining protein MreB [Caldinitratiruptor microaerophilus]|uniref:Cell shape-determining protein MreB n=1 Tax=Caldinitratiruptor microaerophilus TaxID=671077 RepID=A0AA35G6R3_9FIRM|nr:rod shape-determining protein MreB [Caldinitratiruptor microaerophilus]BDG61756.1 rod shape-determining protein [Caldinitratiruptor microaerophilus]